MALLLLLLLMLLLFTVLRLLGLWLLFFICDWLLRYGLLMRCFYLLVWFLIDDVEVLDELNSED